MKKYNTLVLIGRFQPIHSAHIEIIKRSTVLAEQVIIIVGSANQPRTYKNPFTADERICMLQMATSKIGDPNTSIRFESNSDSMYNDQAWAARIQTIVASHTFPKDKIGIIGHIKDDSSFYLNMFPQWKFENVELIEPLNASNVRDLFFRDEMNMNFIRSVVPETTIDFLEQFKYTQAFCQIIQERKFITEYQKQYSSLPYAPVFTTADTVVIQSGHILMVKRRAEPGKGLLALPGGFLNANTDKSMQDCAIRELKEETGIKVPVPVLIGSIKDSKVFDAIGRSARGRTITHAFKIVLQDGELPKVKGGDDAEKAMWMPFAEIKSEECFDDHFDLISWAVGA